MRLRKPLAFLLLLLILPGIVGAEEKEGSGKKESSKPKQPQAIELADGNIVLPVPSDWKQVKPRSRIIAHEFQVPIAKNEDEKQTNTESAEQGSEKKETEKEASDFGRMTIMNAGGGVKANIARWVGQFRTEDGKALDEKDTKLTKQEHGPFTVHTVDLAGTFLDKPRGPFGPSIEKPNYRMLAAIVPTNKHGMWFIKFYGPRELIDSQAESFEQMINGIKSQKVAGTDAVIKPESKEEEAAVGEP